MGDSSARRTFSELFLSKLKKKKEREINADEEAQVITGNILYHGRSTILTIIISTMKCTVCL